MANKKLLPPGPRTQAPRKRKQTSTAPSVPDKPRLFASHYLRVSRQSSGVEPIYGRNADDQCLLRILE